MYGSLGEAQSTSTANAVGKWKGKETGGTWAGRPRRDTISTMTSATSDATVDAKETPRDMDQESDELESSDFEWGGWMRDLDRQGHVEGVRIVDEPCHRQQSPMRLVTPSPTTSSCLSVDSKAHHRPFTLSPATTSFPAVPTSNMVDNSPSADSPTSECSHQSTNNSSVHFATCSIFIQPVRGERAERMPEIPAAPNTEARGGRSTTQAERPHVRGWWDSALDFVNPEGMIGFGAGSFYR